MLRKIRPFLSAILGCAYLSSCAFAATATVRTAPLTPAQQQQLQKQQAQQKAALKGTPMEKLFLPGMAPRFAAAKAAAKQGGLSGAVTPMSAGTGAPAPIFGGYLAPTSFPTIQQSTCINDPYNCGVGAIFAADFNKDGNMDLASIQYDGTLNIMLGDGKGGLGAPSPYLNPNFATTEMQQALMADVNGDGYPDLVALDAESLAVLVYPNLKNGTFGSPSLTNLTVVKGASLGSMAVADVNGDGKLDLVVASYGLVDGSGNTAIIVQTYLGSATSTFQATTDALTQTFAPAVQVELAQFALALGDLNKDGRADLALEVWEAGDDYNVVVTTALGKPDGSFATMNISNPITQPFTPSFFGAFTLLTTGGVKFADMNGDGNLDLIADCAGEIVTAFGDGSGNFAAPVQAASLLVGENPSFELADFNGDGILDMAQLDGALNVWTGKADGTFSIPANGSRYVIDGATGSGVTLGDFNGDGAMDIVQLADDYKQAAVFIGDGKGAFQGSAMLSSSLNPTPIPTTLGLVALADVQGKGISSGIYIEALNGDFETGLNDGKGNLTFVQALPPSVFASTAYIQPVTGDFNGDGKQDLLLVGVDNSMSVAFSKGDGSFQAPVSLNLPALNCSLAYAATGDINGDGITDVVVPYPGDAACGLSVTMGSGYFVVLGTGGGKFAAPVFNSYGNELYSAVLADVNLDGKQDLILDDTPFLVQADFAVDYLPGNGDGTFQTGSTVSSQNLVSQVIVGDFNQDGKPDLVLLSEGHETDVTSFQSGGIVLIPGNGDGSFQPSTTLATGNFFMNGAMADVNNDGIPDLMVSLYQTVGQPNTYFGMTTLLGVGGGAFSGPINMLQSMGSGSVFTGNIYSDNATDVMVETAYGPAVYLGQGGTTLALATSSGSVNFGDTVTLTATVAAAMAGRPSPGGTVSFYDGATLLNAAGVTSGTATFATSALAVGSHTVTAVYSGDANFNTASLASPVSVAVATLAPAFTMSSSASSMTLTPGANGVATLTLTANASFNDKVALTCSGAPANATCAVSPASATLAPGSTATISVVVGTTTAKSSNQAPASPFGGSSGLISVAGVVCLVGGWRSRKRLLLVVPILLVVSGFAITGCGGGSSTPTAKAGSYTLTVTATPSNSSSGGAQTATITVTVQ